MCRPTSVRGKHAPGRVYNNNKTRAGPAAAAAAATKQRWSIRWRVERVGVSSAEGRPPRRRGASVFIPTIIFNCVNLKPRRRCRSINRVTALAKLPFLRLYLATGRFLFVYIFLWTYIYVYTRACVYTW